ncbi:MAG TPA: hypothetical protein VFR19_25315 [Hyphomicrobiaceae bacterium]|jgi:hypothetical protein|nr:hypothetical protein [Hyphomicrobiaceae bacterium]
MRVRVRNDYVVGTETVGRIVSEFSDGEVLVEWDDTGERTRVRRSALEELDAERPAEPTLREKLVDQIAHLRDMLNTSCDLIIRDIEREMKKGG